MAQPKYVATASKRLLKHLKTTDRFADGRQNTARRLKRLLDHPEYGRKLAQLDAEDQRRILTRIHSPFMVSPKKKQQLIFKDIDDTLKRKKRRLSAYKKAREVGVRGTAITPEERARRYAQLSPETRSEAWQQDESTEFWNQYKREMGYVA